jgi:nitrate reductase delta subunit
MMKDLALLAEALTYPTSQHLITLRTLAERIESPAARKHFGRFVDALRALSHAEWEELHTRTLDLSPCFVPYIGYAVWGDNYRRGEFMAELKAAQGNAGIDTAGELPDHLQPALKLMAHGAPVPPSLLEVFPGALTKMQAELAKAERRNPYRHVLAAIAVIDIPVAVGGER